MFAFSNILSQTAELFQSPNLSEQTRWDAGDDLHGFLTDAGLNPGYLSGLSIEEIASRLTDAGIDASASEGQTLVETLQAFRSR